MLCRFGSRCSIMSRSDRGASMVEAALVLPVLLLVLLGSIDFFRVLAVRHALGFAAHSALTEASVIPFLEEPDSSDLFLSARASVADEARQQAQAHLANRYFDTTMRDEEIVIVPPVPPYAINRNEAFDVEPIEIRLRAQVPAVALGLLGSFSVEVQAVGFRERRQRASNPIPRNCLGQPFVPGQSVNCNCPPNSAFHPGTGLCQCTTCPVGMQFINPGVSCECDCIQGVRQGDVCVCADDPPCVPPMQRRPLNQGCECYCPNSAPDGTCCPNGQYHPGGAPFGLCCANGQIFNPDTQQCGCPANNTQTLCTGSDGTWNPTSCTCNCGSGRIFGPDGCVCSNSNHQWNPVGRRCECPDNASRRDQCQNSGGTWNSTNCTCSCTGDAQPGPTGEYCVCVDGRDTLCTSTGGTWDAQRCRCTCPVDGRPFDPATGCDCPQSCGSGMVQGPDCSCACPSTPCNLPGYVRDPSNQCQCVCNLNCTAPYVQASDACACVCPTSSDSCGPGQMVDPATCACVCRPENLCIDQGTGQSYCSPHGCIDE